MDNGLYLFFSDRTETLRDKFLLQFNQYWQNQSAFSPPSLIVPNRLTSKWLTMEWAKKYGIAMMLNGQFLDSFLWQTLNSGVDEKASKPSQLNRSILELWIVDILASGKDESLTPIFNYIGNSAERTVQIAQKLARLLLEYELARPKMAYAQEPAAADGLMQTWLSDNLYFNNTKFKKTKHNALEQWQRALYQRLFGKGGYQSTLAKSYLSLPQLALQLEQQGSLDKSLQHAQGQPVFLWSAGLSAFHRNILSSLAKYRPIFVYQLNPCSEFWEDVDTRSANALGKLKLTDNSISLADTDWAEQCFFADEAEMPLLKAWGHIGKENIKLWCQLSNYDFDGEYSSDTKALLPDNLLRGVQYAVLHRQHQLDTPLPPDSSIRLVEVPNRRREVEVLQGHILSLIQQDSTLKLSDIGVLMPDPNSYRADFEDAFGGVSKDNKAYIPWVFADESAGTSQYAKGVMALIQLLKQPRFDRRAVFNLLRNPLTQHAFAYDADTLLIWESWCDKMGAYYGFDNTHRQTLDANSPATNYVSQWHTFRNTLDRLLLGRLVVDNQSDALPYRDWYTDEANYVELFVEVIETLYSDLTQMWAIAEDESRDWSLFGTHWAQLAAKWLATEPFADEAEIASSVNEAIEHIVSGNVFSAQQTPFNADTFYALVTSHLDMELPSRANILSGRLTITALREGRPIPWKHTFVLGMSAGEFPVSERSNPLDLRAFAPLPGDYTSTRQARYLFLELLMCTRESLTVSWQNYDLANDRPLLPSSIVIELEDFVRSGVMQAIPTQQANLAMLPDDEQKTLAEQCYWPHLSHAVHADEDYGVQSTIYDETTRLKTLALHDAQIAMGKVLLMSREAEQLVTKPSKSDIETNVESSQTLPTSISFAELKDFLINPIEMVLKRQLGLYDSEQVETTQVTDEPLSWDAGEQGRFCHEWLQTALERLCQQELITANDINQALDSSFTQLWQRDIRQGKTPKGAAAEQLKIELQKNWDLDSKARVTLQQVLEQTRLVKHPVQSICIQALTTANGSQPLPADITITNIPAYFTLEEAQHSTAQLSVRAGGGKVSHTVTHELLHAIYHAVNNAERLTDLPASLAIVNKDSDTSKPQSYTLKRWDQQQARQWLGQVISDINNGDYQKHNIPLDAFPHSNHKIAPENFARDKLLNAMTQLNSHYRPSEQLQMFEDDLALVPTQLEHPVFTHRYLPFIGPPSATTEGHA